MHVPNTWIRRIFWVALLAGLAPLGIPAQSAAQTPEQVNPLGLAMTRQHAEVFEPGKPFEISVTISAATAGQITAMGLRETLPAGWRLEAVAGASGAPPDLAPQPGATNLLEFAWITMPPFPYTFSYVVAPPEGDGGAKVLHGALEYRQMTGAHYAAPVMTEVRGPDPKPPTITLKGSNPATLTVGDEWQEPGYTALDGQNRDITGKVVVSGTVDTGTAGEYSLAYSLSTEDGQKATAARSVVVKESAGKQTPPTTGGSGAAVPGAAGRELSNPIAASAGKNPANQAKAAAPATAKAGGEAGVALKKPTLPDLSAFRPPATPQPGDRPAPQPGATTPAPASSPAVSVPPVQHRAPVPPEMLKSAAMKETGRADAGITSFTTPTAAPKAPTTASAGPKGSAQAVTVVVVALVLLGGVGLLGWRLVYNRPVRRKHPPGPPVR
jgi:hypothetical protein